MASYIVTLGVDTTNDEAWAIVNHNSEFVVVPEPSTLVLAALGAAGLVRSGSTEKVCGALRRRTKSGTTKHTKDTKNERQGASRRWE